MFLGPGSNGKSTLISLIRCFLGDANVAAMPLHRLEDDRFATAELYGRLANVFADLDARALSSTSMFKSITGGDAIQGERKFRSPFTFVPYARLIFSANEPPPTPDGSDAFFRRWMIVPFEQSFDGNEDPNLLSRLTAPSELSGLLNMALATLPSLKAQGFTSPSALSEAKERFRVDSDSVAGFVAECCELDANAEIRRSDLYGEYDRWCESSNRRPFSRQRFNQRVQRLHPTLEQHLVEGIYYWAGIRGLSL